MAALRRYPRFLGKSTLFRNPRPVALPQAGRGGARLPGQDGRPDGTQRQHLRHCPAGCWRSEAWWRSSPRGSATTSPALQPLRTGAARIALGAADRRRRGGGDGGGGPGLRRQADGSGPGPWCGWAFPSRSPGWMDDYRADEHRAVRLLTADLAGRLRAGRTRRTPRGRRPSGWPRHRRHRRPPGRECAPRRGGSGNRQQVAVGVGRGRRCPRRSEPWSRFGSGALLTAYRQLSRPLVGLERRPGGGQLPVGTAPLDLGRGPGQGARSPSRWRRPAWLIHLVPYQVVKMSWAGSPPTRACGPRSSSWAASSLFTAVLTWSSAWSVGEAFGAPLRCASPRLAAPVCGYLARQDGRTDPPHGRGHRGIPGGPATGDRWSPSVLADRAAVVDAAHQRPGCARSWPAGRRRPGTGAGPHGP